jgi:hypothetical protein
MPTEALIALASFVGLVLMWVVLPSVVRRNHQSAGKE